MTIEYRIILPKADHNRNDMSEAHVALRNMIMDTWGGLTATEGKGMWKGSDGKEYFDEVYIYDVACVGSKADDFKLTKIAEDMLSITDQHCIYTRQSDHKVVFVERD